MATTALIVELLVVGIFAPVWIAVFLVACLGHPNLIKYSDAIAALIIPYLALAYSLGLVINRFCDDRFKQKADNLSKQIWRDVEEYAYARMVVFNGSEGLTVYLDKLWAQVRLFRSTMLNSALLTVALIVYIWNQPEMPCVTLGLGTVLLIGFEAVLLYHLYSSWKTKTLHYHQNLRHAYDVVKQEKPNSN